VGVTVFTGITDSFEITGFYETDTRHGLVLRGGSATQLGQLTFIHDDKFFEPFGITQTGDVVGTIDPENLLVKRPDDGGEGFLLPAKEVDAGQTYVPVYFREALFLTARGATSTGHVVGFYSTTQGWSPTKGDFHGFIAFHGYPNYVPFPDYQ